MGVQGIWLGLVIAMAIALVGQYGYLLVTVDWAASARRARERALLASAEGARQTTTSCGTSHGTSAAESDGRGLAAADSAVEVHVAAHDDAGS